MKNILRNNATITILGILVTFIFIIVRFQLDIVGSSSNLGSLSNSLRENVGSCDQPDSPEYERCRQRFPLLLEYCSASASLRVHDEGILAKALESKYELVHLLITIRHGDRTTLNHIPGNQIHNDHKSHSYGCV